MSGEMTGPEDIAWSFMHPQTNISSSNTNSGLKPEGGIKITNSVITPITFDEAVKILAKEMAYLVISKQHDYGQMNILGAPFGPEAGITVRLWDKVARLKNLTQKRDEDIRHESLEDTYKDIIGYAILGLMVRRGWFELPLEGSDVKSDGAP